MYYLSFFENLIAKIEELLQGPIKVFTENYRNPGMWLLFFVIGILVFNATYRALQKEK